jgi:6,7-dimethyl-8-ribityllumazine synthase
MQGQLNESSGGRGGETDNRRLYGQPTAVGWSARGDVPPGAFRAGFAPRQGACGRNNACKEVNLMKKTRLGLVVSKFNYSITSRMEKRAKQLAKSKSATIASVIYAPGCCDTPYAAQQLLKSKKVDCIAVLGVLLHGQTAHDEVVAYSAFHALQQLSLAYDTPIGFGIIGPGATRALASKRAEEYAERAVDAALEMARGKVETIREHK